MFLKNKITGVIAQFAIAQGDDWEELTQSEINSYKFEQNRASKTVQCLEYLAKTDWCIIRMSDPSNSSVVPENILINRANARTWQNDINNCQTLEELNAINIIWR